jgi:hypothetical protein
MNHTAVAQPHVTMYRKVVVHLAIADSLLSGMDGELGMPVT